MVCPILNLISHVKRAFGFLESIFPRRQIANSDSPVVNFEAAAVKARFKLCADAVGKRGVARVKINARSNNLTTMHLNREVKMQ